MGNSQDWITTDNSFSNQCDLLNSLIPIEDGQNNNQMLALGRFKIYRFKTQPYQIVMKYVRIFAPDNPKYQQYSQMAKGIVSHIDHKNVAKIHSVNICTRSNICIKQISIESYVNYYAINLEQIIDQRKTNDIRFTTGQVWYVLNSLIDLALYLQQLGLYFGIFLAKNIFLSPEGYIKVYLYHLTPNHKHFVYYRMIGSDSRDIHKFLPISPECLPFFKKKAQQLVDVSFQKMDVFGIGMIAMESMVFNSPRRYYTNQSTSDFSLSFDQKQFRTDLKQIRNIYPQSLTTLIEKLSKVDPKQRFSLIQAKKYIQNIRDQISINGSIKMVQDQQNPIQPKLSYQSINNDEEYDSVLKSINLNGVNKLQIAPLRSISKEKTSSVSSSQYKSLNTSHGMSIVGLKKENRLHLSNMSRVNGISGKKQSARGFQSKYATSLR